MVTEYKLLEGQGARGNRSTADMTTVTDGTLHYNALQRAVIVITVYSNVGLDPHPNPLYYPHNTILTLLRPIFE